MGRNKQKEKAPYIDGVLSKLADPKWMKKQGFAVGDTTDINRVRKHVATMGGSNEADNFIDGLRAALNAKLGDDLFALSPTQKDNLTRQADTTRNTIKTSTKTYVDKRDAKAEAIAEREILQLLKVTVSKWKRIIGYYNDMKRKREVALTDVEDGTTYTKLIGEENLIFNVLEKGDFDEYDSALSQYTQTFDKAMEDKDVSKKTLLEKTSGKYKALIDSVNDIHTKITTKAGKTVATLNEQLDYSTIVKIFETDTAYLLTKIQEVDDTFENLEPKKGAISANLKKLRGNVSAFSREKAESVKSSFDYPMDKQIQVNASIAKFLTYFSPLDAISLTRVIEGVEKILTGAENTSDALRSSKVVNLQMKSSTEILEEYDKLKKQMTLAFDSKLRDDQTYIEARKKIAILRKVFDMIYGAIKKFDDLNKDKSRFVKAVTRNVLPIDIKLSATRIVNVAKSLTQYETTKPVEFNVGKTVDKVKAAVLSFTIGAAYHIVIDDDALDYANKAYEAINSVSKFYRQNHENARSKHTDLLATQGVKIKAKNDLEAAPLSSSALQQEYKQQLETAISAVAEVQKQINNAKLEMDAAKAISENYNTIATPLLVTKPTADTKLSKYAVELVKMNFKLNNIDSLKATIEELDTKLQEVVGFESGVVTFLKGTTRTGHAVMKGVAAPFAAVKGVKNLNPAKLRLKRSSPQ